MYLVICSGCVDKIKYYSPTWWLCQRKENCCTSSSSMATSIYCIKGTNKLLMLTSSMHVPSGDNYIVNESRLLYFRSVRLENLWPPISGADCIYKSNDIRRVTRLTYQNSSKNRFSSLDRDDWHHCSTVYANRSLFHALWWISHIIPTRELSTLLGCRYELPLPKLIEI